MRGLTCRQAGWFCSTNEMVSAGDASADTRYRPTHADRGAAMSQRVLAS